MSKDTFVCKKAPIIGCTNPDAYNYSPLATQGNPEQCIIKRFGCTASLAKTRNISANTELPGICLTPISQDVYPMLGGGNWFYKNDNIKKDTRSLNDIARTTSCKDPNKMLKLPLLANENFQLNKKTNFSTQGIGCAAIANEGLSCSVPAAFNQVLPYDPLTAASFSSVDSVGDLMDGTTALGKIPTNFNVNRFLGY